MYKPKHLFWTWREVLAILNQELCNENSFKSRSEETLKFPSLYGFIKENKEIYCPREKLQLTCHCERCEL